jgi:hypothetical protein
MVPALGSATRSFEIGFTAADSDHLFLEPLYSRTMPDNPGWTVEQRQAVRTIDESFNFASRQRPQQKHRSRALTP